MTLPQAAFKSPSCNYADYDRGFLSRHGNFLFRRSGAEPHLVHLSTNFLIQPNLEEKREHPHFSLAHFLALLRVSFRLHGASGTSPHGFHELTRPKARLYREVSEADGIDAIVRTCQWGLFLRYNMGNWISAISMKARSQYEQFGYFIILIIGWQRCSK